VRTVNETAGAPDAAGWICCDIPMESIELAVRDMLRFGAEIEVLAPVKLREAMQQTLRQIGQFYA
jgi:predicted DNA-binding transcriptional regulator YafY